MVGRCLSNSALRDADGFSHVLVGQRWVDDIVAVVLQVRWLHAAWDRVPAVKEEDFHLVESSFPFKQFAQYHGAGVFTGFGLLLRQLAQR